MGSTQSLISIWRTASAPVRNLPWHKPIFHPTPAPTDEDVARVAAAVCRRVDRKTTDREPAVGQRRFAESAPILVAMAEASVRGVVATGPRRGCRIVRVRGPTADVDALLMGRLCAQVEGYNVQVATRVGANDREGLERMGRYLSRPPMGTDRLSQLEDARLDRPLVPLPSDAPANAGHIVARLPQFSDQ